MERFPILNNHPKRIKAEFRKDYFTGQVKSIKAFVYYNKRLYLPHVARQVKDTTGWVVLDKLGVRMGVKKRILIDGNNKKHLVECLEES